MLKKCTIINARTKVHIKPQFQLDWQCAPKMFFLNTLGISDSVVRKCCDQAAGVVVNNKPHVTPTRAKREKLEEVKTHIKIESHYCRCSSQFEYLEAGLLTSEMYRAYKEATANPVKLNIYRKVFKETKPPLKFHKPIKDQCDKYLTYEYKEKAGALNDEDRTPIREHLERKNIARHQNENDKLNRDITICTFDLQVTTVPKLQVEQAYFL